jgi:hypothetical protein
LRSDNKRTLYAESLLVHSLEPVERVDSLPEDWQGKAPDEQGSVMYEPSKSSKAFYYVRGLLVGNTSHRSMKI